MFHIHFLKNNLAARVAFAGLAAAALPFLASQKAAAAPAYDCSGVQVIPDPGNSVVLSFDGQLSCIAVYDATVSLSGNVGAAVSLGTPTGGTYTYDSMDQLTQDTNSGGTTSMNYDGSELTSATDPAGTTTTYKYDAGELSQAVDGPDPVGHTTTYTYDSGHLETLTDPSGNVTTYSYDTMGRVDDTSLNLGTPTQYMYDAENRLIKVIDPLGDVTTYAYDGAGNQLTSENDSGQITNFIYDSEGRLLSETDSGGNTLTTYSYDAEGLVGETNPTGQFIYTSAVPEPAAWVMLLTGFGGLGAVLRRNRRRNIATSATA